MSMVRRNQNQAIMAAGAAAVAHHVGEVAFSPTGQKLIWDGVRFIASKLWNRRSKKGRGQDLVRHPGAQSGAIAAPVAVTRIIRASRPKFVRSKGSVTVTHRELISQIDTSAALSVNKGVTNLYRVNPSNSVLFPWLQTLATNFDQYTFERVRLQYVPLCGTTTTGRVALYFDKDSQDDPPSNRIELANMAHLTETSPWAEASLNIPTDRIKRFTNDSATTDTKLIDLGQIGVGTYGSTGVAAAGDLFIHYTVTFYEPQPSAGLVSTGRLINGESFTTRTGLITISETSTAFGVSFNSPGTYLVIIQLKATAITDDATSSNTVVNSHFNTFSTGNFTSMRNITINEILSGIVVTGAGFGNHSVNVVRARPINSVTFP
uniref:Capsid protein n=1 Tax=Sikte waterborne virus TaxID=255521 RepID=A0A7R7CRS7_9TOMB|nr:coat protein [Sikte waterborne virus]